MSKTKNLLCEIGTEELPPKFLKKFSDAFAKNVAANLSAANLSFKEIKSFATPRRLAIKIIELATEQPDSEIEKRGPALSAAYDQQGKPTAACEGFARSGGISAKKLITLEDAKGKYVGYRQQQKGQSTKKLMPDIIRDALRKMPIPKPMHWGSSDVEFIRPVHWVVLLLDKDIIAAEILGKKTSRNTYGHRFHHPKSIKLKDADVYESVLEKEAFVIPDFEKRRALIESQVKKIAEKNHAHVVIESDLLDEVTGLVEWPTALFVNFDKKFLSVPQEALIAAMRDHQKSFYVVDNHKKLLAHFITVSNIESKNPDEVIKGNERVMRARLSDAAFFYETDLNHRLESHLDRLAHVSYQAKLGNLLEKSQRLAALTKHIAQQLKIDTKSAERAGLLAKCDLMTNMVHEFPELQGTMGYYYALHDKEPEAIAITLKEQYLPRFAKDELPKTSLGCALAIAERLDTLVGIFAIGQAPTGEKDPYGLRRAALGIIRIILHHQLELDLMDLLKEVQKNYPQGVVNEKVLEEVKQFILERLRAWYAEQGLSSDIFAAVVARQTSQLNDFAERVKAVKQFQQLTAAQALAAANKRVSNILRKENNNAIPDTINTELLEQPAERQLADAILKKKKIIELLYAEKNYSKALQELAELQLPIDQFFNEVMVMVDDKKLRDNRLALLAHLRHLFLQIADISLLQ